MNYIKRRQSESAKLKCTPEPRVREEEARRKRQAEADGSDGFFLSAWAFVVLFGRLSGNGLWRLLLGIIQGLL